MEFGIFYEHQNPRPWDERGELRISQDALGQIELADGLETVYPSDRALSVEDYTV